MALLVNNKNRPLSVPLPSLVSEGNYSSFCEKQGLGLFGCRLQLLSILESLSLPLWKVIANLLAVLEINIEIHKS